MNAAHSMSPKIGRKNSKIIKEDHQSGEYCIAKFILFGNTEIYDNFILHVPACAPAVLVS